MESNVFPIQTRQKTGTLAELFAQQAKYHANAAMMIRKHPDDFDIEKWLRSEAEYLEKLATLAEERGQ